MPLAAVLTATLAGNDLDLFRAAARSLAEQALPEGWTGRWHIWVDGGSTADIDVLAGVVEQSLTGSSWSWSVLGDARQVGVNAARNLLITQLEPGTWCGFLDDDDEYLPGAITALVGGTSGGVVGEVMWCAGRMLVISTDGTAEVTDMPLPAGEVTPGQALEIARRTGRSPVLTGAWFVNVDALVYAGGFGALPKGGDVVVKTGVTGRFTGALVDAVVYRYQRRHGSITMISSSDLVTNAPLWWGANRATALGRHAS